VPPEDRRRSSNLARVIIGMAQSWHTIVAILTFVYGKNDINSKIFDVTIRPATTPAELEDRFLMKLL
jgi:hypothetical protein